MMNKEMTKEEVYSFLRDTEIVCNSIEESKKVQEKLFALGISYSLRDVVTERGLLFITEDLCISNSIDYDYFLSHNLRRVYPSEILAIQIKEEQKPKFDQNTLQPFDKVLVRDDDTCKWGISFFDIYESGHFCCIEDTYYQCVPYNEETKHLHRTNNEAPEYYQIWK